MALVHWFGLCWGFGVWALSNLQFVGHIPASRDIPAARQKWEYGMSADGREAVAGNLVPAPLPHLLTDSFTFWRSRLQDCLAILLPTFAVLVEKVN